MLTVTKLLDADIIIVSNCQTVDSIQNIYSTLLVSLAYTMHFFISYLWKNVIRIGSAPKFKFIWSNAQ